MLACVHDSSPEDCILTLDHVSGRLVCVAHPQQPVQRQREAT